MNAVCSGCGWATLPNPSSVVMLLFWAALVGRVQDRTDFPSMSTVQAPHWPRPQPNLGPCSPRLSRKTYKSGVLESASTTRALPFILSLICAMASFLSRLTCGENVARVHKLKIPSSNLSYCPIIYTGTRPDGKSYRYFCAWIGAVLRGAGCLAEANARSRSQEPHPCTNRKDAAPACHGVSGFGETLVSSYVNVATELQICNRRQGPQIEFDLGHDRVCLDFPSQYRLAANAEVDPGLFHATDHRDIGIVVAVIARLERRAVEDHLGPALVQYDDDLSMIGRHAILRKSIEIPRDRNEAGIHFVDCRR